MEEFQVMKFLIQPFLFQAFFAEILPSKSTCECRQIIDGIKIDAAINPLLLSFKHTCLH